MEGVELSTERLSSTTENANDKCFSIVPPVWL